LPSASTEVTSDIVVPAPILDPEMTWRDLPAPIGTSETIADKDPGIAVEHAPVAELDAGDFGDHDGLTVTIPRLAERTDTSSPPTVEAVHCANLHANDPSAVTCRICGTAVSDRAVSRIARPVLGYLAIRNTASTFPIDRPMLLGRRPSAAAEREVCGETARLVPLPDPEQVLSKVHAEIRLDNWDVFIVDRNSRNATFVTLPGQPARRLADSEPLRIVPGTTIDLAGTLLIDYETGVR
jgi:hypothetical protein